MPSTSSNLAITPVRINTRKVKVYTKIKEAFKDAEYVILAVPAAFVRYALTSLKPEHFAGKSVVSAIKGMIPGANQLVTDWVSEQYSVPLNRTTPSNRID